MGAADRRARQIGTRQHKDPLLDCITAKPLLAAFC
jgi:hypothetical protein